MAKFKEIQPYNSCVLDLPVLIGDVFLLTGLPMLNVLYHKRYRFDEIIRYLHVSYNNAPGARQIKTWKIQTVAEAINNSFATGMTVGPDFDLLLTKGRFPCAVDTIQYARKPHPWGTKCYITCDSDAGCCYKVRNYNSGMGGADTTIKNDFNTFPFSDRSVRFKKYYHAIFVGHGASQYLQYLLATFRKYPRRPIPTHDQFMEDIQVMPLTDRPSDLREISQFRRCSVEHLDHTHALGHLFHISTS
ncbi:LOW QUALITY PROTEIN: Hsp70-like protein [Phytophthora palmivora]|uniref:Hsp70-like protein n=1 Tax=Phytophthora palmivora TaxID=4796 RepID=A0A2P4XAE6_9STRA|nr:LOW QUALITY PROTEIN: Hsp70-like protein [Phytophthora palmivora]